jgi:ATP-dependent RNA helicase DeaD
MTTPSFEALELSQRMRESIATCGYTQPTPIQSQAIPVLLAGRDIVLQAQTGTGKTAAFAIPTIERIDTSQSVVQALVLAPTRELAQQVAREFASLGQNHGIVSCAVFGGSGMDEQRKRLQGAHVVVATPGRLLDFLRRRDVDLRHVRFFGLDEADEMLSMGFEKDVLDIIGQLPSPMQSFLCSATYNDQIRRIASRFIHDPVEVNVSSDELGARNIRHVVYRVPFTSKYPFLRRAILGAGIESGILFANTKAETFRITETLRADGLRVDVLNGDLSQTEREAALARMRAGEIEFLIATDVAARGIDISGLPSVINFDMPDSPDVYVHRTGRTGRAGQAGIAFSLVTPADVTVYHHLQKFMGLRFEEQKLPAESEIRRLQADRALQTVLQGLDADGTLPYGAYLPLAQRLMETPDAVRTLAKLLASHREQVRAGLLVSDRASVTPRAPAASPVSAPAPAASVVPAPAAPAGEDSESAPADVQTDAAPSPAPRRERDQDRPRDKERDKERDRRGGRSGRPSEEERRASRHLQQDEAGARVLDAPGVRTPGENGGTPADLGAIVAWVQNNAKPGARSRFVASSKIAEALSIDSVSVDVAAATSNLLERSKNKEPMWRLHPSVWSEADKRPLAVATPEGADRSNPGNIPSIPADLVQIRVNIGSRAMADANALARELALLSGFDPEDFMEISLADKHSLMNVRRDNFKFIADALRGAHIADVSVQVAKVE